RRNPAHRADTPSGTAATVSTVRRRTVLRRSARITGLNPSVPAHALRTQTAPANRLYQRLRDDLYRTWARHAAGSGAWLIVRLPVLEIADGPIGTIFSSAGAQPASLLAAGVGWRPLLGRPARRRSAGLYRNDRRRGGPCGRPFARRACRTGGRPARASTCAHADPRGPGHAHSRPTRRRPRRLSPAIIETDRR